MKQSQEMNIYITSDEEIKVSDYILYNNEVYKWHDNIQKSAKKIILTTDQDLIKDGVQAIDDEFLEWFVKNPSCEFVKIKHKDVIQFGNMTMRDHNGDGSHYFCINCQVETSRSKEQLLKFGVELYEIIIPKEEPKQECILCHTYPQLEGTDKCESCYSVIRNSLEQNPMFKDSLLPDVRKPKQENKKVCTCKKAYVNILSGICSLCWNEKFPDEKEEINEDDLLNSKQETLEEEAKNYGWRIKTNTFSDPVKANELAESAKQDFIAGAKWQAERMYSEEDLVSLLEFNYKKETNQMGTLRKDYSKKLIKEWFEQFKKK